jgi:hypothetical protein
MRCDSSIRTAVIRTASPRPQIVTAEFNCNSRLARGTGAQPAQHPERPAPTPVAELIRMMIRRASAATMPATPAESLMFGPPPELPRGTPKPMAAVAVPGRKPPALVVPEAIAPTLPATPAAAAPASATGPARFEASADVSDPRMAVPITEVVRSNHLFTRLAKALRLSDDEARFYLQRALADAKTRPDSLTPEELWFMLPRIESDVLVLFVNQDATIRRDQLHELVRRSRYESINATRRALEAARTSGLFGLGYARPA